ncbi:MAG: DMT family transporter [Burkholderiales bacterium]|nr:DMT family transporter [Burkholderiales bacterium]
MPSAGPARVLRGIALMVGAGASFALLDTVAKTLTATYPSTLVAWARYFFHVLVMLVVLAPRVGRRLVIVRLPGLQVVRGICLGTSTLCFFGALAHMPLAEATAIVSIGPILVALAAVRFLGERAPPGTGVALLLSFVGVLLIVRPGGALFGWAAALPLVTALATAGYQLSTRMLSGRDDPVATLFIGSVVATALMSAAVPLYWVMPVSWSDLALFVATGAIGAFGHWLLVLAYERAPATVLAPFGYAHAVMALPMGWLVFGNFPDRWALTGMALIVATGVGMAMRRRRPPAPDQD